MSFYNIPQVMRNYTQWIVWCLEDRNAAKPTKVPYNPLTGRHAKVTDPSTWTTFEEAVRILGETNKYSGLGFVLTENDPFAFIDLDDPKGNQAETDKQIGIFHQFNSYSEKSPSGSGLHIIVEGSLESGRRRGSVEVYSSARYMTMTGEVYKQAPIANCQEDLSSLWNQLGGGVQVNPMTFMGCEEEKESDEVIHKRASNAVNGQKFTDLYSGNWQDYYTSQSEADFALVDILAFYTQSRSQIVRMFRASGLGQREKAQRDQYVKYMLDKCFDRMLPPVDVDGLSNQLNAVIEAKRRQEVQTKVVETKEEIEPSNSVYTVPPGLVGEIARFIHEQAPRPVPEIALAGAIGLMSGIVGRAYNVSGTGLNQYVLLLAPTGTGKEAIASGVDKLFNSIAGMVPASSEFIGPAEIASQQAVIKYMSKGPTSFVSLVGEFGIYLQQMASKTAPPHLMGLRRFLLDAYNKSGEGKVLRPSIYSDKDKNTAEIISPSFSLMGESTPEKFYEGLHEGLISEGLLPRFTTIEYTGIRPPLNPNHIHAKPSFDLTERLGTICAHALMLNSQSKAVHVHFDDYSKAIFSEYDAYCDLQINNSDKEVRRHLWNRAHIKAMKLAALVAVGCDPYHPTITKEVADWSIGIVSADARNLLERFNAGEIGIDNDETKQLTKVVETIKEYVVSPWQDVEKYLGEGMSNLHSNKIVPYSFIQRKLASVAVFRKDRIGSSGSLKRAIGTLLERGDIQEMSRAVLSRDYQTGARCFVISHPKTFEL